MASQLRLYVTDLEQRVSERTKAFQVANMQLKAEMDERKQAEEALKTSETRYRTVSQSASDAIVSANHEGNICRLESQCGNHLRLFRSGSDGSAVDPFDAGAFP